MKPFILNSAVIFSLGAVVGFATAWRLLKTKYERIANEEIESVKEVFSRRGHETTEEDVDQYITTVDELGYSENNEDKEEEDMRKPYVIPPDEFGELECEGYESVSLTYYADGVLTDDFDEVIEDVDSVVGKESLTHFGEWEDDSVFVRNERQMVDYEILMDTRKYSELTNKRPHLTEDE